MANPTEDALSPLTHAEIGDDPFFEFLVAASHGVEWYAFDVTGDWQGEVSGVGIYDGKLVLYEDSYGSCSLCGAWGEGGEPCDLDDVLSRSTLYTAGEARACLEIHCDDAQELRPFGTFDINAIRQLLGAGLVATGQGECDAT